MFIIMMIFFLSHFFRIFKLLEYLGETAYMKFPQKLIFFQKNQNQNKLLDGSVDFILVSTYCKEE